MFVAHFGLNQNGSPVWQSCLWVCHIIRADKRETDGASKLLDRQIRRRSGTVLNFQITWDVRIVLNQGCGSLRYFVDCVVCRVSRPLGSCRFTDAAVVRVKFIDVSLYNLTSCGIGIMYAHYCRSTHLQRPSPNAQVRDMRC